MKLLITTLFLVGACGSPPPPPDAPTDSIPLDSVVVVPPLPQDSIAECPDSALGLAQLQATIDSLRGLPPDTAIAACSICEQANIGWMCMLPAD